MHKSGEHDFWTCTGDLVKKDPLPVLVPKKEPAMMHPWLLQDEKKNDLLLAVCILPKLLTSKIMDV